MKIPTDLIAGDIFHTNMRGAHTFIKYVESSGEKWADTKDYSFLVDTGFADPTEVEVVRIQRVNSSGVSEGMQRETDAMIRQERCTKGRIAIELQYLLAQHEHNGTILRDAIEAYKTRLFKEAEPS